MSVRLIGAYSRERRNQITEAFPLHQNVPSECSGSDFAIAGCQRIYNCQMLVDGCSPP